MYLRMIKYSLKKRLRSKETLFWSLIFPLVLGTLFFATFGGYMDKMEVFSEIPVAYVESGTVEKEFATVLDSIENTDSPIIKVEKTTMEKAKKLLEDEKISGIFSNSNSEVKLYVKREGIKESILKTIVDQYEQTVSTITNVAMNNPQMVEKVVNSVSEQTNMIKNEKYTDSKMDSFSSYFYALIAMSCLFGAFMGVESATSIKADISALGARRLVSCTNKFVIMSTDIIANILVQFTCSMLGVFYLKYVLHMECINNMLFTMLIVFLGSFIGIATGFFIGSIGKKGENFKTGIAVLVSMSECFLSGLMVSNMYYLIQQNIPILNKINPAALIVDAFYSLDIYSNYERFTTNIIIMFIIAMLLCIGSFLAIRRERYASI